MKIKKLGEEITFLEIKYRLLKNKKLIGIFTILSILVSSFLAFNQKYFFSGKMYFSGNTFDKLDDRKSTKTKININDIVPSMRRFVLDKKKIEALRKRSDNVVYELANNPIILKRVYSNLESNNFFKKDELKDFNSWSNKFSLSDKYDDSEFLGIFFVDSNKSLVINSLNLLKKEILLGPEYKRKMNELMYGYSKSKKKRARLVFHHNFFGPSVEEIKPISKFIIIFTGTLFGISLISLFSIYKDTLKGILSNQKNFIELIPYPLLRNFPIKEKNSWQEGLKLLNNEIQIKGSNICLITISRKFPDELNLLKKSCYEYGKNTDVIISNKISLDNNFSKNILVVYPNEVTEENLLILIQDLKNSGKNILGWIYLY